VRDLIVTENVTLDGVIDAAGGWFDPAGASEVDETDLEAALRRQRQAADAFLTGRRTFEDMRSYWPGREDDETGISAYLDSVEKYVVSSSLGDPGWEPTTVLRGLDKVAELKRREGRDIVATGSISLVHALIDAGLPDEYRLFVFPVVVGEGARLFEGGRPPSLELAGSESYRNGVVLLRYRAGDGRF
jgi:dihydrofolate reductase